MVEHLNILKLFKRKEKEYILTSDEIKINDNIINFKLVTNISDNEIKTFSIEEQKLLKNGLINILIKYGLASKEVLSDKPNLFSKTDIEWFNKTKKSMEVKHGFK